MLAFATLLLVIARLGMALRRLGESLAGSEREAQTDELTGLANRRALMGDLEAAVARAPREGTTTGPRSAPRAIAGSPGTGSARREPAGQPGPEGPRGTQGPQGQPGIEGQPGIPGASGLADYQVITGTPVASSGGGINLDSAHAYCPAGRSPLGGGFGSLGADDTVYVRADQPVDANPGVWYVQMTSASESPTRSPLMWSARRSPP